MKENAFRVPEAYFDKLPGKLQERIAMEEGKEPAVRRLSQRSGFRLAMAAVFAGLALLSIPLVRNMGSDADSLNPLTEIALLESAGFFSNELEVASYLEGGDAVLDDEEAYVSQAMDYLAMNDVALDMLLD